MNKKTLIAFAVTAVLCLGAGFGMGQDSQPTKEVTKTVEVEKNQAEWKQLKDIDDRAIQLSADAMGICSQGFTAVGNLDAKGIEKATSQLPAKTSQVIKLGSERQEVLKKLGY